jgi:deoxyhypusine synthase
LSIASYVPYAQIVSSSAAAIGLFVTAWQFWRSRKTTTLQNLQDFFKSVIEREAALAQATDDPRRRHAFNEYIDFLEVYSAAVMGGLFTGIAKELVCDKLIDSIVTLERAPQWHDVIDTSVTSVITYKYIVAFMAKHRKVLAARRLSSAK